MAIENDAAAGAAGSASVLPECIAWHCDETIVALRRNRAETKVCSNDFDQAMGCDHAGNHHQPVLPPVLQDSAVRHSKAASYLGLTGKPQTMGPRSVASVRAPHEWWIVNHLKTKIDLVFLPHIHEANHEPDVVAAVAALRWSREAANCRRPGSSGRTGPIGLS